MARKRKAPKQTRAAKSKPSRPIWKGSIEFGLVNIPVALYTAEAPGRVDFDLLDKRDFSRVRYRRVSEKTGREVPWEQIVKGYEHEKGDYVALSDEELRKANVEASQSIHITEFIDGSQISPVYYYKPYYLEPLKNGRRAYALLREVMKKTGKVGIAKVVIRTRQHLAALTVEGPLLILNLLRFAYELRDAVALEVPEAGAKGLDISSQELKMAERLVEAMIGTWNPEKYRDEYRDDILNLIDRKIESGKTKAVAPGGPSRRAEQKGKVIDIMHLLQQSVEEANKKEERPRRRKAG